MMEPNPLSLICLAPEPQCEEKKAFHLAKDLADLLNFDNGLPEGIRRPKGGRLETAETLLSFTKEWCIRKNARFYAIVLDDETAIGSISLSHIDICTQSARSGYWLGSSHHGFGYGTKALTNLVSIARSLGLKCLLATISSDNLASQKIWEKAGASISAGKGRISATMEFK